MHFFTNAFLYKNYIYYSGYDNGERVKRRVHYSPYLFLPAQKETGWKTLEGQPVSKRTFESISEANKFIREHKDIDNFKIYGNTNFLYTWINDTFPGTMEYDSSLINIIFLDIEVASDKGVPDYKNAIYPVTAITISKHGKKITFGCGKYTPKSPDVAYVYCKDEKDLLKKFLTVWNNPDYNPDVLTGWNVEGFDIPYLYNRIKILLGDETANKLSPWGIVEEREIQSKFGGGSTQLIYDLKGISTLDYFHLYKKFSFKNQESFALGHIAHVELGEKKVDFSEYESLLELYKQDYEKFIDYNIHDVVLVEKMDDKFKILEQVFALAYDAKITYSDTLATIRAWDTIIHNYLLDQYIVVPQQKKNIDEELIGAYVKEPQVGMHKWVVSFDLTSLYPSLIQQYNIGPDTFIGKYNFQVEDAINKALDGKLYELVDKGVPYAITANLCYYRKDKQSFLGALMEKIYKDRDRYKKQMIAAKQEYEATKNPELKKKIAQFDYLQMAKKIQLNSGYGAIANPYFRYYSHNNAEAITATGQLAIRWVEDRLNKYLNTMLKTNKDYIIASDTDSLYIGLGSVIDKFRAKYPNKDIITVINNLCNQHINPFIEKCYEELAEYTNAYKNCMVMKREVIADKGVWTAKKRYILNVWDSEGIRYKEPKLKIQGVESVRSSTPSSCRENIRNVLKIIMNKEQNDLLKFIEDFREEFKTLPVDEIAFPRSINGLVRYGDTSSVYAKGTPIQVKGALIYNNLISKNGLDKKYPYIYNGDKVKFVYLKTPNPLHEHVISFINAVPRQFGLEKYIDYDTQFQKGFLDPVRTIVEAIGWKLEETATLEDFM